MERHFQAEARDLERHVRRQRLAALELAAHHGVLHRLLDLALRVDADHLQELADAEVERFLVHAYLPESNFLAISLPSSTPHWSKLLIFHTTPWTNTLCS